ncbi:MAG: phytanoyl-CoA dioxygenase family protein [Roseivirga sp.]
MPAGTNTKEPIHLTQEQYEHYQQEGYVILKQLFTAEEVAEMRALADQLKETALTLGAHQSGKVMHQGTQFVLEREQDKATIQRIVWAGAACPRLLEYGRDKRVTHLAAQILQSDQADHLINQIHYKLPGDQVQFGWHRDIQNRRNFDPNWDEQEQHNDMGGFVQVITAIDAHTEHNGPLRVIPGSHKDRTTQFGPFIEDEALPAAFDISKTIPLLLAPGDTVLMHVYLLHNSLPNHSTAERKTLINGFSLLGSNHEPYPGEGSAQPINLR